jgi:hypothetical protein
MPEPNLNQLATPLGDFLPMRLSWMFIGYSTSYQVFSGIMEIMVGLLLLNRKTVTLGALLGTAVFTHVFLLNMSYDIPVKLHSMQLVICCLYLAHYYWQRIVNFFILNKSAEPAISFNYPLTKKWQRIGRVLFKIGFIYLAVVLPFQQTWGRYKTVVNKVDLKPITSGFYAINAFEEKNGAIPGLGSEMAPWKDIIFEKGGIGSINTPDTLFRQIYRRGYFSYQPDTVRQVIRFMKYRETNTLFELYYKIPDDRTISLWEISKVIPYTLI